MRAKADASRSMLYETARFVDVYKALDDISKERKLTRKNVKNSRSTASSRMLSPRWVKA